MFYMLLYFKMKRIYSENIHEYKSVYDNKNKYIFCEQMPFSDT